MTCPKTLLLLLASKKNPESKCLNLQDYLYLSFLSHVCLRLYNAKKEGFSEAMLSLHAIFIRSGQKQSQRQNFNEFKFCFLQNFLRVSYKGPGKNNHKDASSVRATHCIPASCGLYYYEVKIVSKGRDGYMGIGLSHVTWGINRLPGWDKGSYG